MLMYDSDDELEKFAQTYETTGGASQPIRNAANKNASSVIQLTQNTKK